MNNLDCEGGQTAEALAVQRARRSRTARTKPGVGRRVDLLLDRKATIALNQLSEAWSESMTGTVSRALLESRERRLQRRALTRTPSAVDDPLVKSIKDRVQQMRTLAWYQVVRLGLNADGSAEIERKLSRLRGVSIADGSWAKYYAGLRVPSEAMRNIAEAAVPGSRETFDSGPYGSMLWVALLCSETEPLWEIVTLHSRSIAILRSKMRPFREIVLALQLLLKSIPTASGLPTDRHRSHSLALPNLKGRTVGGLPNEYCVVSILIAMYRLSGMLYQTEVAQELYELLHQRIAMSLRGIYAQLQIQLELDGVVDDLNAGLPRGHPGLMKPELLARLALESYRDTGESEDEADGLRDARVRLIRDIGG